MKKFIIGVVIFVAALAACIAISNDDGISISSGLEKDLIASLPEGITSCYVDGILNVMEVTNFKIDRQSTEGNFKSADCTIELDGDDLKKIVYANLSCIKYDDGSWAVESWSELEKPKLIPKFVPTQEDTISMLQREFGFKSMSLISEDKDLENGKITYYFKVNDSYQYVEFVGEGVSCCYDFGGVGSQYDKIQSHRWSGETKNNTTAVVKNVTGTWRIQENRTPPRWAEITINTIGQGVVGMATFAYPTVDGNNYTGDYHPISGEVECVIEGNCPKDFNYAVYTDDCELQITCDGLWGYLRGVKDSDNNTVIKK